MKFILNYINLMETEMKATAKELRFYTKELLESVQRGEEVIITYRGAPCAKLIPLDHEKEADEGSADLFGIWKDNEEVADVSAYVRKIRQGRF